MARRLSLKKRESEEPPGGPLSRGAASHRRRLLVERDRMMMTSVGAPKSDGVDCECFWLQLVVGWVNRNQWISIEIGRAQGASRSVGPRRPPAVDGDGKQHSERAARERSTAA